MVKVPGWTGTSRIPMELVTGSECRRTMIVNRSDFMKKGFPKPRSDECPNKAKDTSKNPIEQIEMGPGIASGTPM
jgi:hypothetical protein